MQSLGAERADGILLLLLLQELVRQLQSPHLARHFVEVDCRCCLVEEVDALDSDLIVLLWVLGSLVRVQGLFLLPLRGEPERLVEPVDAVPLAWLVALRQNDLL